MNPARAKPERAPLWHDLGILILGVWAFILQCWKSRGLAGRGLLKSDDSA